MENDQNIGNYQLNQYDQKWESCIVIGTLIIAPNYDWKISKQGFQCLAKVHQLSHSQALKLATFSSF
jgi:hypothetical protein